MGEWCPKTVWVDSAAMMAKPDEPRLVARRAFRGRAERLGKPMRNITSHKTDMYLMLCAGVVGLLLGIDSVLHGSGRDGGINLLIAGVNFLNAWRTYRREVRKAA